MQNFVITITYTNGTVEKIPAHCTIEQIEKAVEAYKTVPSVKTVVLQYK